MSKEQKYFITQNDQGIVIYDLDGSDYIAIPYDAIGYLIIELTKIEKA